MAWFKVDDGFYTSQKVLSIPRKDRATAVGVWLLIGTWSADKMTDGLVPHFILEEYGCTPEIKEALVLAGLWKLYDNGSDFLGIEFHDWCDYQPTKAQLQDKQKARSEAGKLGGQRSGEARRSKSEAKPKQNEANPNPEPEPEPEPKKNTSSSKLDGAFDIFWFHYPRKVGKDKARAAFKKMAKTIDPWKIIDGAERVSNDPNLPEPAFIPYPTTWLNRGGWDDEAYPGSPANKELLKPSVPQPPTKEELKSRECQIHHGYPMPCTRCEEDNA